MLTVENYSLALLFYFFVGISLGVGTAALDARQSGVEVRRKGLYVLGACLALVYGFLGLGVFGGGLALYIYIPVLLVWWTGKIFGASLFPVGDLAIAGPIFAGLCFSVFLYHWVL